MAFNFPSSPTNNQVYTFNSISYVYNSTLGVWRKVGEIGNVDWSEIINKPDPVITLNSGVSGSATMTDLTSVTINATVVDTGVVALKAPIASPTFTGTVNLPTVSITGVATTSSYINRTTANGNSSWLQQDGTGRVHWYWNTLGGTSPTFTNAAEDASALTLHVNNNGNGGTFFHRSANGASASAGGPITWITTLYVDLATITYKGNRIPTVADKLNAFSATTSAELAGIISDETGSGALVFATSPTFSGTVTAGTTIIQGNLTVNNNTQSRPSSGSGITINWNYSGGAAENNFWNLYLGATTSFVFRQLTGTGTTHTDLLSISPTGNLTTTGTMIAPAATTSISSIRLPHGTAPTAPTNGDMWTTTAGVYAQINGATVGPLGAGSGGGIDAFFLGGM